MAESRPIDRSLVLIDYNTALRAGPMPWARILTSESGNVVLSQALQLRPRRNYKNLRCTLSTKLDEDIPSKSFDDADGDEGFCK